MKTKEQVNKLWEKGLTYDEIADELNISKGTVGYHIRDLGKGPGRQRSWKELYDWDKIQDYYDEGHTWKEIKEKFGISNGSLAKAKKEGTFETKGHREHKNNPVAERTLKKMKYDSIKGDPYQKVRLHARRKVGKLGITRDCANEECGWEYKTEVCHIRAISDFPDNALIKEINALSNLVLLCSNCHWLLENKPSELGSYQPLVVE